MASVNLSDNHEQISQRTEPENSIMSEARFRFRDWLASGSVICDDFCDDNIAAKKKKLARGKTRWTSTRSRN